MRRGVSAGGGRGVGFEDERPPRRPQSGTGQGEQRSRLKSPYSLSLTPRDLTGAHGGDLEGPSSLATRAVYLQVPQPKEYRQLRSRSSYERGSFDVLPDSARRLRSARPRMQVGSGGDDERAPAGYDSLAGDAYEDKGTYLGSDGRELHSQGVSSWGGGAAAPPQPSMQDPSPRRRSTLPPTPVPADSWAGQRTGPAGAGAVDGGLRRGQMLRELAPVIQAIAGLTHETNLGKLVRQIHAVVLVLAQADACRVCLYDAKHKMLQYVPPGDQADASREHQYGSGGVTGLVASSGTAANAELLQAHPSFDSLCDLGDASLGAVGPNVSCVCVACKDKTGEVVAVVAAVRMGSEAQAFSSTDEDMMGLLSQQAGVAISLALQRADLARGKWQSKVLTKAAVELGARAEHDAGSLSLLTSVYAKKLCEAESAHVYLTYNAHRWMRTWEMVEGHAAHNLPPGEADFASQVKMVEHDNLPVPPDAKKVVTTGVVSNYLVQDGHAHPGGKHGVSPTSPNRGHERGHDPTAASVVSVLDGDTVGYTPESDSFLLVPLQTEHGGRVIGYLQVSNRRGGPRVAGRHGLFPKQDEEALRELAFIAASAFQRVEYVNFMEQALAIAPALTACRREDDALHQVAAKLPQIIRADRVYIFSIDEDGNFQQLDTSNRQDRAFSTSKRGGKHVHHRSSKPDRGNAPMLRLPANTYPLSAGVASKPPVVVTDLWQVSDKLLGNASLIPSAHAMMVSAIREPHHSNAGAVRGVVMVANVRDESYTSQNVILLGQICSQAGATLANCAWAQNQSALVSDLEKASLDMLSVVDKREVNLVISHVQERVAKFMVCSRAVLYLIDKSNETIWTVGPNDSMIAAEAKQGKEEDNGQAEESREGFANLAMRRKEPVLVRDFAYGQAAFNDLLDSADLKHVEKLLHIQTLQMQGDGGGGKNAPKSGSKRAELEPEEKTESIAALPIRNLDGDIVAVLQVMNKRRSWNGKLRKDGFDSDDMVKLNLMVEAISRTLQTCAILNRRWEAEQDLREIVHISKTSFEVCVGACARMDPGEALSLVARSASSVVAASQVAVYLSDERGQMDVIRFEGSLFRATNRVKCAMAGIAGRVLSSGMLLNIADARSHADFHAPTDEKPHTPVSTILASPIKDPSGKIIGALVFINKRRNAGNNRGDQVEANLFRAYGTHTARKAVLQRGSDSGWEEFSALDETHIEAAARGLGVAFAHHRLLDHVSLMSERLRDVSQDLDLDRTVNRVSVACRQVCKAERCVVLLLDETTGEFRSPVAGGINLPGDFGIPGAVRRAGGPVIMENREEIADILRDYPCTQDPPPDGLSTYAGLMLDLNNCIAVPILNGSGRIVGVLEVGNHVTKAPFSTTDARSLQMLASHVHVMVEHCRTYEASQARHAGQERILHNVVQLVEQVAATFPQTLADAQAYFDIVNATVETLGGRRGKLCMMQADSNRQWVAYSDNGKMKKESCSSVAMSVFERGCLINNTRVRRQRSDDPDPAGEDTNETSEDPHEMKLMCAPIIAHGQHGLVGTTVVGVLQVEAHDAADVWELPDEDVLTVMAKIAGSLVDIMRQIRVEQNPASLKQTLLATTGKSPGPSSRDAPRDRGTRAPELLPLFGTTSGGGSESERSERGERGGGGGGGARVRVSLSVGRRGREGVVPIGLEGAAPLGLVPLGVEGRLDFRRRIRGVRRTRERSELTPKRS